MRKWLCIYLVGCFFINCTQPMIFTGNKISNVVFVITVRKPAFTLPLGKDGYYNCNFSVRLSVFPHWHVTGLKKPVPVRIKSNVTHLAPNTVSRKLLCVF